MINSKIGYIICESDITPKATKLLGKSKMINGKAVGEGVLQTADEKNRNGRFYAEEDLFPQLKAPRTLELLHAGYLRAEMGHPLSKDLARQSIIDDEKTCARFLSLWTEGKDICAQFVGTNNKNGTAFDLDLKEGCLPAWSLRALGSIQQTHRGAEVKNIRLITWDQVIYPSHPGAYTRALVEENAIINEAVGIDIGNKNDLAGAARIIPITDDKVISYLQSESANLKFIRECCDFMYSGIQVNEAGTKVLLTTEAGETLVINMESYIHNELMNYATDLSQYYK